MVGFTVVAQTGDEIAETDELLKHTPEGDAEQGLNPSEQEQNAKFLLKAEADSAPEIMQADLDRESLDWARAVGRVADNEHQGLADDDAGDFANSASGPPAAAEYKWKKFVTAVATAGVLGILLVVALANTVGISSSAVGADTTATVMAANSYVAENDCVGFWTVSTCTSQCFENEVYTYSHPASRYGKQCDFPEGLTRPHICAMSCEGHWVGDCNDPATTSQHWVVDSGCGCVPPYCADDLTLGKVLLDDGQEPGPVECEQMRHARWLIPGCGTNCFADFDFDERMCEVEGGEFVASLEGTACTLEVAAPDYTLAPVCQEGEICPHVPFTPTRVRECAKDCLGFWETDVCNSDHCIEVYTIAQEPTFGGEPCEYPAGATRLERLQG